MGLTPQDIERVIEQSIDLPIRIATEPLAKRGRYQMLHWYAAGGYIHNGLNVYHPSEWKHHRGGYLRFGRFQIYLRWSVKRKKFFWSVEWLPPRLPKERPVGSVSVAKGWPIPKDWNDAQSLLGWHATKKFGITIWKRKDK